MIFMNYPYTKKQKEIRDDLKELMLVCIKSNMDYEFIVDRIIRFLINRKVL